MARAYPDPQMAVLGDREGADRDKRQRQLGYVPGSDGPGEEGPGGAAGVGRAAGVPASPGPGRRDLA